jgi:hypothetical protein
MRPEREWLAYGMPVEIVGLRAQPRARFWRFFGGGDRALIIQYNAHNRPAMALVRVSDLRVSQRFTDPPPMPRWTGQSEDEKRRFFG